MPAYLPALLCRWELGNASIWGLPLQSSQTRSSSSGGSITAFAEAQYDVWLLDRTALGSITHLKAAASPFVLAGTASARAEEALPGSNTSITSMGVAASASARVVALAGAYSHLSPADRMHSADVAWRDWALPISSNAVVLLFRQSWLTARAVQVPATWDELIAAARTLNGSDPDQNGSSTFGICMDAAPRCMRPAWVEAVAASFLQYRGPAHGVFLDPREMQPLANASGMHAALDVYRRLLRVSPTWEQQRQMLGRGPAGPDCMRALNRLFAMGRCAFAIHTLQHWPVRTGLGFVL